jgi:hypothetical protein
MTLPR